MVDQGQDFGGLFGFSELLVWFFLMLALYNVDDNDGSSYSRHEFVKFYRRISSISSLSSAELLLLRILRRYVSPAGFWEFLHGNC